MTVNAPVSTDEVADLLLKGKQNYPDVKHTTGQLFEFTSLDGDAKPAAACALGYILLGEYNGDITADNHDDYYDSFSGRVGYDELFDRIVELNDTEGLTIERFATGSLTLGLP